MSAAHSTHFQDGTREQRRASWALFFAGLATFALLYCVQPLLPELAKTFDVSPASSSLALSMTTLSMAACLLIMGALSESWGRKAVMVMALGLAVFFGLVSAWAGSWTVLLSARMLLGVALSGLPALAMAYIGEEFDPTAIAKAMGLFISGNALGGLTGRLLAGALSDWHGWRWALAGIGLLGLCSLVMFVYLLPRSRHFEAQPMSLSGLANNFVQHLRNTCLLRLFALAFLLMGSFVALFNYIAFQLAAPPFLLSQILIGLLFVVYLLGIVGASLASRWVTRFGAVTVMQGGVVCMMVGVILCLSNTLAVVIVGLSAVVFGFFAAHAVASGQVGVRAKHAKAQASALYLSAYYLGSSIIGYGMGYVWEHGSWLAFIAAIVAVLAVALVCVSSLKRGLA